MLCVTGFRLQWVQLSLKWTLGVEQKGLGGLVKHEGRIRFSGPPAVLSPPDHGPVLKHNIAVSEERSLCTDSPVHIRHMAVIYLKASSQIRNISTDLNPSLR